MSDKTTEVIIFSLYGGKLRNSCNEQGKEEARLIVSRENKWPPSAAFEQWVLDTHPAAGRYAAVALEGTGGHRHFQTTEGPKSEYRASWATMNIFTVTYPEAMIETNGDSRPIGARA